MTADFVCRNFLPWCHSQCLLCCCCFQSQMRQKQLERLVKGWVRKYMSIKLMRHAQCRSVIAEDEALRKALPSLPSDILYMKQTIGNACGTIGLLHSIGNSQDKITLGKNNQALTIKLLCCMIITTFIHDLMCRPWQLFEHVPDQDSWNDCRRTWQLP